ncbi:MAG: ComEC/Rec2 family competence protein [Patescibacteria group bacterium]
MRLHDIFFWFACFFLAGVLVASIASGFANPYWISALLILVLSVGIFVIRRKWLFVGSVSLVILSLVVGSLYFFAFDAWRQPEPIPYGQKVEFSGIVSDQEQRIDGQKIVVGNIQLAAPRYPEYKYGDEIKVTGVIKTVEGDWENYFKKENIAGLMGFPEIELISRGNGSKIKFALLEVKAFFISSFQKVLPFDKAAFMSGLVLGETAEFSDEFKEKLRATGTSHLVALSGYNIAIIASTVANLLSLWWFTKRFTFAGSTLLIFAFVLMTGGEASVVRAAIMGFLVLLADRLRRVYYFRNAVAFTALAMVLVNPKVLAFDIGFQLSFMALIGITYLKPLLEKWMKWEGRSGIINWRQNLLTTSAAQVAVLPVILYHFGTFSPIGVLANVLILEFIPLTMGLGFFIAFSFAISPSLALVISWPASILMGYELGVISFFAKILSIF